MALSTATKAAIRRCCVALVIGNTLVFLALALAGRISNAPETIVFVDFWGRLTVYSFWFLAFAVYRTAFAGLPMLRTAIVVLLLANIPAFLAIAYLGLLPSDPVNAVLIDFWGRLTVYSLWFMAYLAYNRFIADDASALHGTV